MVNYSFHSFSKKINILLQPRQSYIKKNIRKEMINNEIKEGWQQKKRGKVMKDQENKDIWTIQIKINSVDQTEQTNMNGH